jgi:hypothetical protein
MLKKYVFNLEFWYQILHLTLLSLVIYKSINGSSLYVLTNQQVIFVA